MISAEFLDPVIKKAFVTIVFLKNMKTKKIKKTKIKKIKARIPVAPPGKRHKSKKDKQQ